MPHHSLSPTTHTTELRQIAELNARIAEADGKPITAGVLGMADVTIDPVMIQATVALRGRRRRRARRDLTRRPTALPASAVLKRIVTVGPPSYPYVYGLFGADRATSPELRAPLHTAHLRLLSERYRLRQSWGV
jgi:hypothetical protein